MKTAVLIPCYNEATSIEKVINDFKQQLPDATIYVYDNNSTDNTADIARRAGAVVKHEFRQGKGNVVRSMFRDIDADCYLMVDGDDTYPAENAKEMCQLVEEGADMVIGDRLSSTYFTENKRPFHNDGNRLVRFLINKIFNNNIHDIMTGYRALSHTFVKNFPIISRNFEIETEMTIHALDKNFLIRELKINYRDRQEGSVSKLNTYLDGMKVVSTIFMMFRDYRPLKFFTIISALLLLIAIAMFVPVFIEYMQTGLVPRFPTLIVSGFIGIASLLTFFCGVVLEVITKKHKQLYELMLLKK
ncbi:MULTISPECIES: glycosyltransferase family 2 protein [Prevotella]|jgi:glycosyltransferase involved in cell wall biosynthesis|uniref:glycosyltransferase family 2 protein n=1 Tax=Prevotella TaxID=838 RepID=UPI000D10AB6E|nr:MULTISPECIES: glycosyltransferase family 2 protein [Prevotella]